MAESKKSKSLEIITEKVDSIPSLPEISGRIVKLVNREKTTIEELSQAIRTDPSLASLLLRYANSSYYGLAGKINNIQRAITVLGFNTVRSLALSYGVEKKYTAPEIPDFPRQEFWDYSLAVGAASEIIARRLSYDSESRSEAFSAGHLHAIGKTIIDQHLHEKFVKIFQVMRQEEIPMYEAEQKVLETTHCEVGAEVLKSWDLPEKLSLSARYYHEPEESDEELVTVVHFASVLAKTLELGFSGDCNLEYLRDDLVDELELKESDIEAIIQEELPSEFDKITAIKS